MPYKDPEEQRAYQREWMARRRQKWLSKNGPCVECGTWDDLEVDHVDPASRVSHKVFSWRKERREKELAKCQVLCRPCHQVKSLQKLAEERDIYVHGTASMYKKHGCRCGPCRAWKSEANRRFRSRPSGRAPASKAKRQAFESPRGL